MHGRGNNMDSEVAEDETPRTTTAKKKTKRRGRRLTGLSKQRRIANTRERNRVHVINESIDRLRDLIPLFPNERRPSKTDTIRLAALYISHMTELLAIENPDHHQIVARESLDEEMSVTSLEFDPFDVETGELAVFFWKEDELSGGSGSDLSSEF